MRSLKYYLARACEYLAGNNERGRCEFSGGIRQEDKTGELARASLLGYVGAAATIAVAGVAAYYLASDFDKDGYSTFEELRSGSNAFDRRSVPGNVDGDSLPDSWEMELFGSLKYDEHSDPDQDSMSIAEELILGTNPAKFEQNVKHRLIELGYPKERAEEVFNQVLNFAKESQADARRYNEELVKLSDHELRSLAERSIEKYALVDRLGYVIEKGPLEYLREKYRLREDVNFELEGKRYIAGDLDRDGTAVWPELCNLKGPLPREDVVKGDWDRDGISNLEEILDGDPRTNPFDPTNSFGKLKEGSIDYVDRLVECYDSRLSGVAKTLPEAYGKERLIKTLTFVENYPRVAEEMNRYGADALLRLLNDMLGDEEYGELMANERYKQLMHAVALQAQTYFYDVGEHLAKLSKHISPWVPKKGTMLNGKLDPEEMEVLRQRWDDRDLLLADGENRLINLRARVLNTCWFFYDGETGRNMNALKYEKRLKEYEWWDPNDTDGWMRVALKNAQICPIKREEILNLLKTELPPETKETFREKWGVELKTYQDFALFMLRGNNTHEGWGKSGKRWGEYYDIVLERGTDDDRLLFALIGYTRAISPVPHEEYIGTAILYASFLGKNIYSRDATIPVTGRPLDGFPDGGCAPVISDQALRAILEHGNPIYDPETGAWPEIFGVDPEILARDKVKYVTVSDGVKGRRYLYP